MTVHLTPWSRKLVVIRIPLYPATLDEPKRTHVHHVWTEHVFGASKA